jgi:hypothetical protein
MSTGGAGTELGRSAAENRDDDTRRPYRILGHKDGDGRRRHRKQEKTVGRTPEVAAEPERGTGCDMNTGGQAGGQYRKEQKTATHGTLERLGHAQHRAGT